MAACRFTASASTAAAVQGPEVRSGDLNEPAELVPGEQWTFTITEGEKGVDRRISVNYDGFVHDVSVGDELLVDGGIMTFEITEITGTDVVCTVRPPPPRLPRAVRLRAAPPDAAVR